MPKFKQARFRLFPYAFHIANRYENTSIKKYIKISYKINTLKLTIIFIKCKNLGQICHSSLYIILCFQLLTYQTSNIHFHTNDQVFVSRKSQHTLKISKPFRGITCGNALELSAAVQFRYEYSSENKHKVRTDLIKYKLLEDQNDKI